MIDIFYYSIANKKANQTIDDLLHDLLSLDYISSIDKKIIKHTLEVSENGNYPDVSYYSTFYSQPEYTYKSLAEIVTHVGKAKDFYHKQFIERQIISSINDTNTTKDLLDKLSFISDSPIEQEFSDYDCKPILYSDNSGKPETKGLMSGISEVDSITNGWQRGTIATIGGFTGHGKALSLDTKLWSPDKQLTMGEVKIGDRLWDKDGKIVKVLDVFDVPNPVMYELTFSNGCKIKACEDHLWCVYENNKIITKSTKDLLIHTLIPTSKACENTHTDAQFDFYRCGYSYNSMLSKPSNFLKTSIFQRKEFLAGVMDSCGSYENGILTINCDKSNYYAIRSVLVSLGAVMINSDKLQFYLDFNPFLNRFKNITFSKPTSIEITDIKQIPSEPARCIMVDSETRTYLCGDIPIVTHNSTFVSSSIFKNVKEGKKCCLVSLELSPEIIWPQFQARYLYEEKGISVTAQDLIMRKLTKEQEAQIAEFDEDFKNDICSNLLIIDESYLNKSLLLNYKNINRLLRWIDTKLGGLDLVAWDHVGQLELLYPDCGNQIIKQIQSSSKTFVNSLGEKVVNLFAVQCNRDGEKRARKRGGVYDLQAISDLNECLHPSCTTLVRGGSIDCAKKSTARNVYEAFQRGEELYTPSVDYKTGKIVYSKIINSFITGYSAIWYRLIYPKSGNNKLVTPSHRVLVNGKKVRVDSLPKHSIIDTIDWVLSEDSEQIILGTLLGDSSFNSNKIPTIRLCQSKQQKEYLDFKCKALKGLIGTPKLDKEGRKYTACSKSSLLFNKYRWCKTDQGYKNVTKHNLQKCKFSELALAIWYLDDGWLKRNSKNSYYCSIGCTNFGIEGAKEMQNYLKTLGYTCSVYMYSERRSIKDKIELQFNSESSKKLQSYLSRFNIPCINHKIVNPGTVNYNFNFNCAKSVVNRLPMEYEIIRYDDSVRPKYNFTVDHEDHNYLLPGGLISANCERSSSYIMFIYTSDDMKVVQECKIDLKKHRLGSVLPEPVTVTFNPAVLTVGSTVDKIEIDDDFMSSLDGIDFDDEF